MNISFKRYSKILIHFTFSGKLEFKWHILPFLKKFPGAITDSTLSLVIPSLTFFSDC